MHNYDYALPTGVGPLGKPATWLKVPMDKARVPDGLQAECVRFVIDRLTAELTKIVAIDPVHIHLVDSRNCLAPEHWANELHPRAVGFKLLAEQCWLPLLQKAGLA